MKINRPTRLPLSVIRVVLTERRAPSGLPHKQNKFKSFGMFKGAKAEALGFNIILPFSQLGGLQTVGAWSRHPIERIIEDQFKPTAEFPLSGAVTAHGR